MVKEYDAEFKHWLAKFLRDFFQLLGLGDLDKLGKATSGNVDQVARSAMPDQIIRIDAKEPFCVHLEVDTSPPPDGPRRYFRYAINAALEYDLPVYSIRVFLRKSAWTRAWTGTYQMNVPFPEHPFRTLVFCYRVVKIWLLDPKSGPAPRDAGPDG